jgi:osmoprotectant transport system ATP-binding protein
VSLIARDVVKRYRTPSGTVDALVGVSIDVADGECVALVGESGSGKTTLLRCFNRLVEPDSGVVLVDDADVRQMNVVELRRHVGYVLQDGGLMPHWTVRRNVELVPWLIGAPNAAALAGEALTLVGFRDASFDDRYPRHLSGGQRQRVAMARALAAKPTVLLLDEPFGALDAITRADLQDMFVTVRKTRPVTCILVTHDLFEAQRLADRVIVMRAGRFEQVGSPREIAEEPATSYVAMLVQKAGLKRASAPLAR